MTLLSTSSSFMVGWHLDIFQTSTMNVSSSRSMAFSSSLSETPARKKRLSLQRSNDVNYYTVPSKTLAQGIHSTSAPSTFEGKVNGFFLFMMKAFCSLTFSQRHGTLTNLRENVPPSNKNTIADWTRPFGGIWKNRCKLLHHLKNYLPILRIYISLFASRSIRS